MPIGDLLASITGEKGSAPTTWTDEPAVKILPAKRKANDDLQAAAVKAIRTERPTNGLLRTNATNTSLPNVQSPKPSLPAAAARSHTSPRPLQPTAVRSGQNNSSNTPSRPSPKPTADRSTNNRLPSRPAPAPARTAPLKEAIKDGAAPKKGSFQEIMSRARANQATRGPVGKIQHKAIDPGMSMKERKEMKVAGRLGPKGAKAGVVPGRNGSAVGNSARTGSPAVGVPKRNGSAPPAKEGTKTSNGKKDAPAEETKKVKKAAVATTGYSGTARPRPGAPTKADGTGSKSRPAARDREQPRYGGGAARSRGRYDDYDEELDDFIDYDEEEDDEPGYGRRYADYSDESDMEAGVSDIDGEEETAERIARREDLEEQRLLDQNKREKDKRKQLWAQRREKNGAR